MKKLAIALAVLILSSSLFAQTTADGRVTMTGMVTSVKPVIDYQSGKLMAFEIGVYLQFRNETAKKLIIFDPARFIGKKMVVNEGTGWSETDVQESLIERPWEAKKNRPFYYDRPYDPFDDLIRSLGSGDPPLHTFDIIEPGGYLECRDTLTLTKGYYIEVRPGDELSKLSAVADHSEFKLEYRLSLKDRAGHNEDLATAKRNWSRVGELPLDANGDYVIISNAILNMPKK